MKLLAGALALLAMSAAVHAAEPVVATAAKDQAKMLESSDPKLAYATDEEVGMGEMAADPEVNQRDLGSDPLAFARRRMALSRELWDRWQTKELAPDEGRDILYRNVVAGFNQYAFAAQVATKYVGGVVYVRDHAGSARANFTPVSP